MNLSPDEVSLFYKIMWPLQFYVNQKRKILSDVESVEEYIELYDSEERLPVRDALYEHADLIDAFIQENPAQLSRDELEIARSWKKFVAGKFYIERYLKKGTVFIGGGDQVYMVQGLMDDIQDIFAYSHRPPIMVKAVLLPFKDRIIYDGLFQTYSIFFGGGIKRNLKEIYMAAKQNGRIIESLSPALQAKQREQARRKPDKDWRSEVDELVKAANKLKGQKVPIRSEAFSLLKASAQLTQAVVHNPEDLDALWKQHNRVIRAIRRLETTLDRAEM